MNLANVTRNQHFLPQVEQRLNTSTPDAATKNQRIYEFAVQGRGDSLKLGEPSNPRIRVNLALDDVFSFDVAPAANLRQNFEALFQRYEDQLVACTTAVLEKAAANTRGEDIRNDLMALFAAKFLNFMRNPFSVPKMLDTFSRVATLRPTDKEKDEQLDLVLNGSKPHQAAMCKQLELTEQQYQFWLGTLFMMLTTFKPESETLFDGIVRALFNNQDTAVAVTVARYTDQKCLLSDRAFSSSIAVVGVDCIEFNLRHDAFIRYVFAKRENFVPANLAPRYRDMLAQMPPTIVVDYPVDDLDGLKTYNWNVINQSHSRVFCAAEAGIVF